MSVTINDFGASGGSHSSGVVPDPGSTAGTSKFLREDATWQPTPGNPGGFYFNLAPSTTALSNVGIPGSRVQLSGGGDALLTLPSGVVVDGVLFQMRFVARVHADASNDIFGDVLCGGVGATVLSYNFNPGGPAGTTDIAAIVTLSWDSTLQKMYGVTTALTPNVTGGTISPFSMPSTGSSDFYTFVTGAAGNGTPNTCSITLTEFSLDMN